MVNDIMKGTPTHDRSLKWLKVTCFYTKVLTYLPGSFLFEEKYSKQTRTSLRTIFPVNLFNSQFCGYIILNPFAPYKTDFPDSACELSLITNLHMNTTFTWHLNTCLHEIGLLRTVKTALNLLFVTRKYVRIFH